MDWDGPTGLSIINSTSTDYLVFDYERFLSQLNLSFPEDDPEQYSRDLLTYYLLGICGMIICILGLIGNMLSLIVLTRKHMRSSTYSYLSALSVTDSLVLLFTIILLIKDLNRPRRGIQRWPWDVGIYPVLFPYIHPLAFTFQVTSIWLTLAFTVDRYIMICHPFKAEPFCTISRARKVIVSIILASVIFNIPKFFEYKTVTIHIPMQNVSRRGCDLTKFGRSHIFRELYHSWFYIVFVCGLPFVTLAVLNSFLIHAVHLSRQRGKEINAAERKRNDTTIMLIGVVVVFFICQMPALVSRTIWAFEHDPKAFKKLTLYTLNEFGNFLIVLNSAINIVPYYFFGQRFRKVFWKLFCNCLLKYEKFQKLTRSYSLTVLDQNRRCSGGSMKQMLYVTNNGNVANVDVTKYIGPRHSIDKPDVFTAEVQQENCDIDSERVPLAIDPKEVNGNCMMADTSFSQKDVMFVDGSGVAV